MSKRAYDYNLQYIAIIIDSDAYYNHATTKLAFHSNETSKDKLSMMYNWLSILSEKSLAIYFEDSQFSRNRTFNFIVSKIYVDKRSRERRHLQVDISHNVKSDSDLMSPC